MLIGVDVGGTFTDAVLALDGRVITAKAPTTPEDQSEGVLAAIEAALERRPGANADQVEEFSHGMTVATNALLEGRGATHRVRRHRGVHRPDRARPPGSPRAVPAVRRAAGAARPGGPALRRARADDAGRAAAELDGRDAADVADARRRGQARGGGGDAAPLLPPPRARAGDRRGARGRALPRPTSRSRTRSSAPSASTSGPRQPRSTRRCPRCWRAICAGSPSAWVKRTSPSPRSCSQTAA